MPKGTHQYTAELARHLRLRGMDEAQILDAARTVESHVADSGGTAQETFGSPRRYARTFSPGGGSAPSGRHWYVVTWVVASLAAALLLVSWSARDEDTVLGVVDPQVGMGIGAAVLLVWLLVVGLQLTRGPQRRAAKGGRG